jgi:CDP-glucose 4,6-dehydratase
MLFSNIYKGKTIFVTGHTGFKGSWLCEWLLQLGAKVIGFSLETPTKPSHFSLLELDKRIFKDIRGDVRDLKKLSNSISNAEPDFIFHLAAQPIVRLSFKEPILVFSIELTQISWYYSQ